MEIGKPLRKIVVEPIRNPVPQRTTPAPAPDPAPPSRPAPVRVRGPAEMAATRWIRGIC